MAREPGTLSKENGLRRKGDKTPSKAGREANRRWWGLKGKECGGAIAANVKLLMDAQTMRLRQNVISTRLYGNVTYYGAAGRTYARIMAEQSASKRMTYNAIQSIVDTLQSRIGEDKPRPYYLTNGGNYKEQRRAKKLNKYVEGVFYETDTYAKGLQAFRDGAILGDGFMYAYNQGGKTHHEVVSAQEIWIDEVEAQYGHPRTMMRAKLVDRDELTAMFQGEDEEPQRELIRKATMSPDLTSAAQKTTADMLTVIEAWRLGSPDEKGDMKGGFHAMALMSGECLVEPEEWALAMFPFARLPWCQRPTSHGYWSQGLCEQLQGEQLELNENLSLIQRSMRLAGVLKVMVKVGSKIVREQINNDIGSLIYYTGDGVPQFYCPEPIHQTFFSNVNLIIERMYRKAGVSEMSASSKKPAGLNSGKALREAEDIESDRHRTIQRQNDDFYMKLAAIDVALAGELPAGSKVRVPNQAGFDMVDFKKDIGTLKGSEFVQQCFPVSKLPTDPAGRLATIQEYIQAGFITPRQGRRALDFADLDSIESLANAQEDMLTKVLDAIVDDGEYQPPEPTDDLSMASEMVIEYIQRYRALGLEDDKLELLRTFNTQIQYLMDAAAKAAAPPASPPGMPAPANGPQAAPMAPPQSDLIPNAPGAQATA